MAQMASISFPADWDASNLAQKRAWFVANKAMLLSAAKVRIRFCGVHEIWDDPEEMLADAGFRLVEVAI